MTAVPEEVLGLKVEVVRSPRRTAALHIVGSDLQVRVPKDLGDELVTKILRDTHLEVAANDVESSSSSRGTNHLNL